MSNSKRRIRIRKNRYVLYAFVFFIFTSISSSAIDDPNWISDTKTIQQKIVSSKLKDSTGFPLAEAIVIEKGLTNGMHNSFDGICSLTVSNSSTFVISFPGYVPQKIKVAQQTNYFDETI
ncbi:MULTISPECIES: carboxypeptidase-like regulatory domain-containing protein [Aestuariivivens]|uniref:carboxypeptidase-like regulatory domain-containing protein n=1 Tax=Aestuariivivens TaxID=1820275 RepID=UPI001F589BA3|nr:MULTISPECIES: carboxypeptidase-like regulatory domain-containing protein [Aestuariivivens]